MIFLLEYHLFFKIMSLGVELKQIKRLEKYKKSLFSYLVKYFVYHAEIPVKDAVRIVRKSFSRWYFDGIRNGKVVDFVPQEDIVCPQDLKYIFQKVGKVYVTYKPFVFYFHKHISDDTWSEPVVDRIYSPETKTMTFHIDKYNYSISLIQYGRLRDLYLGPPGYLDDSIMMLLLRYGFIGSKNNHLSVPPPLLKGGMIELFGSPLNTCSSHYCSPLAVDKRFGSLGSFFNHKFRPGNYLANPPFVADVMTSMSKKLLLGLEEVKNLTIYVVIPVWDEGATLRGLTYEAWDMLKESPYLRDHRLLDQFSYPFYDYYNDQYIPVSDTHFILLSNNKGFQGDLTSFVDKWGTFKEKIVAFG